MVYTLMIGATMLFHVATLETCQMIRRQIVETTITEIATTTGTCIEGYELVTCVRTRGA